MREIQDLTLNVARGLERLKSELRWSYDRFLGQLEHRSSFERWYGLRITAVPVLEDLPLDRVYRGRTIIPDLAQPSRKVFWEAPGLRQALQWDESVGANLWRPIVRGARTDFPPDPGSRRDSSSYREIHCDGLLEWGFFSKHNVELNPHRPIVMFANVATWADRVRRYANVPAAEYAIEVHFHVLGDAVTVKRPLAPKEEGKLRPDRSLFPKYSLRESADIPELLALFWRDFWNFLGEDVADEDLRLSIENWPESASGEED